MYWGREHIIGRIKHVHIVEIKGNRVGETYKLWNIGREYNNAELMHIMPRKKESLRSGWSGWRRERSRR
jgi:hypothetical protein